MHIAVILLSGLMLLAGFFYLKQRALSPLYLPLFVVAPTFVVRPLMIITGLDKPFPPEFFHSDVSGILVTANLAFIAWVVLYVLGSFLFTPMAGVFSRILPKCKEDTRPLFFLWLALVLTCAALLAEAFFIARFGSLGGFIRAVKVSKEITGLYFLKYFPFLGSLMSVIGLWSIPQLSRRPLMALTFLAMLLADFFVIFSFGERFSIGLIAISGLIAGVTLGRIRFSHAVIGGVVAVTLLFLLSGVRYKLVRGEDDRELTLLSEMSVSLHFSEYDALLLLLQDFSKRDAFRNGEDFYAGAAAMVPRVLWPDRPTGVNPGKWFRQLYQPQIQNGWPLTMIGEWYMNFSWIGIVFGAVISGAIGVVIHRRYSESADINAWSAVVGPFFAMKVLFGGLRVDSFQQGLYFFITLSVLALALSLLEAFFTRRRLYARR